MMLSEIKKLVPRAMREPVGRAFREARDQCWRARFGRHASLVPPRDLMHDGPQSYQDFKRNGDEFLRHYVELCGLQPDEHMLDVGSGIGRKTLPLVDYLSERGSYDGLELVKSGVEWCRKKYTSKYPNFRFHLIDVYNDLYNREGKYQAAEYRFPFADEQFDFVVLNSVFTHMLADEVENYLREVTRVLKPGGRCLISFFLLNDESIEMIEQGKSIVYLSERNGPARTLPGHKPEFAIGFDEDYVIDLYKRSGLEIRQPVLYGWWCGRRNLSSCQDQIVAYKTLGAVLDHSQYHPR